MTNVFREYNIFIVLSSYLLYPIMVIVKFSHYRDKINKTLE